MPMDEGRAQQLMQVLEDRFFSRILAPEQMSDENQKRQNRLTRSLSAFVIKKLADVDEVTAVEAVIDGYDDNGIDAIHYESDQKMLVLVQSKFKIAGGEPNMPETNAFITGIRDVLQKRYDRFNALFQQKIPNLDDALEQTDLKIVAVLAHLGDAVAIHAQRLLDDLLTEINTHGPRLEVRNFGAAEIMGCLTEEHATQEIRETITLENWYFGQQSPRVLYGQVHVHQLAELYVKHQKSLFARNIRYFVGNNDVNEAIAQTLRDEPQSLFLLNNAEVTQS